MRNPHNDSVGSDTSVRPKPSRGTKARRVATLLDANGRGEPRSPERTCVLTRRKGSRDQLVRLALGPGGEVAPDVRARAPGRGAWIGTGRVELYSAVANGKLKAALQRAFKTSAVTVPLDLAERTERALRQAVLDRLGMEARAGNLINGTDKIETAARSGKVHMLIHAADAGEDGRKRLDQAQRVGRRVGDEASKGVIFPEERTILSLALGRENVVHVALIEPAAAARVHCALVRWRAFIDPDAGLEGGDPALRTGSAVEVEGTE